MVQQPSILPPFQSSSRLAFARSEFLILLGLVVMVLSFVVPSIWAARENEKLDQVVDDFQRLATAMDRYFNEYYLWPSADMGLPRDAHYGSGRSNAEVINILQARSGSGNEEHARNMNRIVFLEAPRAGEGTSGLTMEGAYLDPWAKPYEVVIDTDADGHCYAPGTIYGRQPDQGFLLWTCGPDRLSGTSDDVLAWRRTRASAQAF